MPALAKHREPRHLHSLGRCELTNLSKVCAKPPHAVAAWLVQSLPQASLSHASPSKWRTDIVDCQLLLGN